MNCLNELNGKKLAVTSTKSSGPKVLGIEVPKNINNSCLFSKEFTVFQTLIQTPHTKQNFEQNNYTDKLLKEDIEINKHYNIISEAMFDYLRKTQGYECRDVICRYARKEISTNRTYIEVNLQKVRVVVLPDWSGHSEFEVVQFSKYDTVKSLYSRLIHPDSEYDSYELNVILCNKMSIRKVIKAYKNHKVGRKVSSQMIKIIPSEKKIALLGLNEQSLLILEILIPQQSFNLQGNNEENKEEIDDSSKTQNYTARSMPKDRRLKMILWRIPEQSQRVLDFVAFVKNYYDKSNSELRGEAIESKSKSLKCTNNENNNKSDIYDCKIKKRVKKEASNDEEEIKTRKINNPVNQRIGDLFYNLK